MEIFFGENRVSREIRSLELTIYLYRSYDKHEVPRICITTIYLLWLPHLEDVMREKFTLGDLTAVNMNNCGCINVRKYREIKESDKYTTFDILLKFGSLDKMKITSSNPKDNLGISGKGLITSMSIKAKARPKKYKKARYAIVNINMKDLSMIIRKFEKLPYKSYEKRRPKHKRTES